MYSSPHLFCNHTCTALAIFTTWRERQVRTSCSSAQMQCLHVEENWSSVLWNGAKQQLCDDRKNMLRDPPAALSAIPRLCRVAPNHFAAVADTRQLPHHCLRCSACLLAHLKCSSRLHSRDRFHLQCKTGFRRSQALALSFTTLSTPLRLPS